MASIPLTNSDAVALVDDADAPTIAAHSWRIDANGYAVSGPGKALVYMHRLLLQPPAGVQVDHANRQPLDNRRANLRYADAHLQAHNRRKRPNSTSAYWGVARHPNHRHPWRAQIRIHGRQRHLGCYSTEAEAAQAYDAAARAHYGDAARTNY